MENSSKRVLAFNLATEITEEELSKAAGGSANITHGYTSYTTNHHGQGDTEYDDQWD